MTDELKRGAKQFGFANILTIAIVVGGGIFNYAQMDSRVGALEYNHNKEITDRRIADEKIRFEFNVNIQRNSNELVSINNKLSDIKDTLNYHLGLHAGQVDNKVNGDKQ